MPLPPPRKKVLPPARKKATDVVLPGDKDVKNPQGLLLDIDSQWQSEWKGMPEFVQKKLTPLKTISVHFETLEDLKKFSEIVQQTVTTETRSIWYPKAEIGSYANKRYV